MAADLPFAIAARLSGRSACNFIASYNGKEITAEKYTPGDGSKRQKIARTWAKDDRLRNGQLITSTVIARELERLELEAIKTLDKMRAEDDQDAPVGIPRASYADHEQIVELAWNETAARTDFIVCDRQTGNVSRADRAETSTGLITVPSLCHGITTPGHPIEGAVFVPTECDPAGQDETRLRDDIETFIHRYVELPAESVALAIEYVLLTWLHDVFSELPYLAFRTADPGRGKSRALETVGMLCYRPLFVGGGSSAAATLRMLDIFGGTLVADEFDQGKDTELAADLNRILNQGFQQCRPLIKCDGESNQPRPFRCFGPKVFALRGRLADDATESRTLSIHMQQRTRKDIPINLPREPFDNEARHLRSQLLAWRLANLGRIRLDPSLADPKLEDRANQIGLPLLSVARSEDARGRIITALKDQQAGVAAERADTISGEILEAILAIANPGDTIRPGEAADAVNRHRAETAGTDVDHLGRQALSPRRVGSLMTRELELPRAGRDRGGVLFHLAPERIEQLTRRYGVRLPGRAQRTYVHPPHPSASETGLFDSASGDNVRCAHDVRRVEGGVCGDDYPADDSDPALQFPPPEAMEPDTAEPAGVPEP